MDDKVLNNYLCYVCNKVTTYDNLSYICKCIHKDTPNYRGICLNHGPVPPRSEWIAPPENPEHHHLEKIHKLTPEYDAWCDELDKNAPNWSSMTLNTQETEKQGVNVYDFTYYEYPNNMSEEQYNSPEFRFAHKKVYTTSWFDGKKYLD